MFLVGELGATINADRSPFDRTLNSVFRDGGRMMQRLGTQMTMALTLPLAGAGALAIKTAADYEKLQTSMAVLNGSVEEGARQFERLQQFSARTPFQLQDLARAQNMLQGFGLSADEAFNSLSMIGDIAAVSGGSIEGIGIAFGQAAAEGRLMTRDIRQLINQGVPAIKLLADSMGVASDEIFDLAEAGEISFQDLQKAFQDATTEGGMFANGMQKQSQTISGLFSTLRDNVDIALGEIGKSLVDTFNIRDLIRDLTESIQEGINWFNSLSQETRRMAFYVAGLLGASGPIIAALGTLSLALGAISAPITGAVAAVAGGAALLIKNWETVENYFTIGGGAQMWEDLKGIVKNTVGIITGIWETFGDNITTTAEKSFSATITVIEVALGRINDLMAKFNGSFDSELNVFEDNIFTTLDKIDAKIVGFTTSTISMMAGWSASFLKFLGKEFITDPIEQFAKWFGVADKNAKKTAGSVGVLATKMQLASRAWEDLQGFLDQDFELSFAGQVDKIATDIKTISKTNISKPFIEAEKVVDRIVPALDMVKKGFQELSAEEIGEGVPLNLGEKILPPGSLARVNERLQEARNNLQSLAVGSQAFDVAKDKVAELQQRLINLQTHLVTSDDIWQNIAGSLGDAFARAAVESKSLLDNLIAVGKQLASKAIITALQFLLPGGPAIGKGSFFGALFGGFRANGGSVFAGNAYRVGETNQPEMFIPSTNGSIHPMTSGSGMPKRMQVSISGTLRGKGSELRAVINESQYIDLS